jgi:hypothetical protein
VEKSTFILGDLDGSVLDDTHSIHTTDKSSSPCSICLEPFQISDSVTWSRADVCRHVFHTDCIHEWFSNPKHEDCPLCRAQIIHLDQSDEEIQSDNNDAGILYTVMDGLVSTMSNPASWITGEGDSTETSQLPILSRLVASDQVSHLGQTLELDDDESMEGITEPVVSRSGLFATRAFRLAPSSGLYAKVDVDGAYDELEGDGNSSSENDEDSLRLPGCPTLVSIDEEDLESGQRLN